MASGKNHEKKTIVVIGNGMVGHRFCECLVEYDTEQQFHIVTFCEEARAAYDRVGLTQFFAHRNAKKLALADADWYRDRGIELRVGDLAEQIDREAKKVTSRKGVEIQYDHVVLATGSYPFVPPVPGIDKRGVFVYRTIEDLEQIIEYGKNSKRAAVIGGGLLGLEAAKATHDLGLKTFVIERSPGLMPRQLDESGAKMLAEKITQLGVRLYLNRNSQEITGNGKVEGILFEDGEQLPLDMIVVSTGIRPRDELARQCGLDVGERGGVKVDNRLLTSDESIFAIGEVALHRGMVYGLVAPGYEMADVAAARLTGQKRYFTGADMSTKLKLMGVDVASFGQYDAGEPLARAVALEDPLGGVYKKLLFTADGKKLIGGILVGDTSEYGSLLARSKGGEDLTVEPASLLGSVGGEVSTGAATDMPDDAQVCSCNNVTKGQICSAIRDGEITELAELKQCTKAGTGCGGCLPLVSDLLNAELSSAGKKIDTSLCQHFDFSRQELYEIIKVKQIKSFEELLAAHGQGRGCEICKPTAGSIFASLWNEHIVEQSTIQDTNDRFLANIQRGGTYSVVPRVPGGEITPDKLITLGEVAKKYGLYTKITGGQRIDLFGAPAHQLPEIWEQLIDAGFESGHAYGKALRTVKSCVGTTWCRMGVGDAVGLAIRIEERYRGIRAPHKIKSAVSGCVRECAEAQCKDFGLIATDNGWNLYVCGNGGATPRHADLLAADLDEETCIRYIDRFLMYYIQTADKLTRTSKWLDTLPGGIDYLQEVVIEDKLGINDELEQQMQTLVDTYKCEWKEVVRDPEKRKLFRQFINTDETEPGIEMIGQRDQHRPADWPSDFVALESLSLPSETSGPAPQETEPNAWIRVGAVDDFPDTGGAAIKYGDVQIAVFHDAQQDEWYASQNMCPHRREFVLSRGLLGDASGEPKIACPLHKKTFSLQTGRSLSGEAYSVRVFPVKVDGRDVLVQLPPKEELAETLSTKKICAGSCASGSAELAMV